ncbi:MAG TPA: hypothetical protein PLE19_23640 [Planctomycetota bacterium]|nr:hypothetical protein [Planctomycetota bacterium]HRR81300.1 hypothetical protein [Planctomycetota bacterium]HRT95194.1 hypothetical protein [Planctomycetota bacterium]
MIAVSVADLKSDVERHLDAVARGETVEVWRRGMPVAILAPAPSRPLVRWKTSNALAIAGLSLSKEVIATREENP